MGLTGRLSDHDLTALFQRLTGRDWRQVHRRHAFAGGVAPDGRRRFGAVRETIMAVLEQAGCELRVRDIQQGVEELLGEPVSRSSVKAYLRRDARRRTPLFENRGRRGYRLRR